MIWSSRARWARALTLAPRTSARPHPPRARGAHRRARPVARLAGPLDTLRAIIIGAIAHRACAHAGIDGCDEHARFTNPVARGGFVRRREMQHEPTPQHGGALLLQILAYPVDRLVTPHGIGFAAPAPIDLDGDLECREREIETPIARGMKPEFRLEVHAPQRRRGAPRELKRSLREAALSAPDYCRRRALSRFAPHSAIARLPAGVSAQASRVS